MKELEKFAFEGVPEIGHARLTPALSMDSSVSPEEEAAEKSQVYEKQVLETKDLIGRLQKQLTEVEQWAYEVQSYKCLCYVM